MDTTTAAYPRLLVEGTAKVIVRPSQETVMLALVGPGGIPIPRRHVNAAVNDALSLNKDALADSTRSLNFRLLVEGVVKNVVRPAQETEVMALSWGQEASHFKEKIRKLMQG